MTHRARFTSLTVFLSATLAAGVAAAQAPAAGAEVSASTTTPATATTTATTPEASAPAAESRPATPWIKRWRPVRNSWELGLYLGAFIPSKNHEFYHPNTDIAGFGHQPLARAGLDLGLRAGYYPLSFLGLELEGGVMPMKAADASRATLYTFRPVIVAQLPYRIAPFIRGGFGLIGISSGTLGRDIDPSFNIGGGVKFYVNRLIALRLDVVDNVATAAGVGNARSNNLEVLLGLSLRLGADKPSETRPSPRLIDSDGDGLYDPGQRGVAPADEDACPLDPGLREHRGCPLVDSDKDGLYDPGQVGVAPADEDACPAEPGPRETQGCPLKDTDKDTLYDPGQPVPAADVDDCPNEPGPRELHGCPDRDGDKIIDRDDKCPDEPETVNQIDDADGCPDKVPDKVKKMSGVLEGIYFDVDKDTIKPRSRGVLDKAVRVLREFPTTRWSIQGHTDSDGNREHNLDLSTRRAEAVKRYLVERGIEEARLEAKGFGPDAPIDTNATKKGKAKNRRIEFRLMD
ncbi:MAG: OmpA family protein [Myxococcales bacterium]|nr:OmpA family protein [Myxococcales bacterium]